jgi:hypothetical protein
VPVTNILCQTKRWFAFSKIGFCANTKVFEEALNAVIFLGWLKKFGPAQNILGPVKGQGISIFFFFVAFSQYLNFKDLARIYDDLYTCPFCNVPPVFRWKSVETRLCYRWANLRKYFQFGPVRNRLPKPSVEAKFFQPSA